MNLKEVNLNKSASHDMDTSKDTFDEKHNLIAEKISGLNKWNQQLDRLNYSSIDSSEG